MARTVGKSKWVLILIILAGIVVGSFIGYMTREVKYLTWLDWGMNFSIGDADHNNILFINLGILVIQFGVSLKLTISSILGVICALFIYRKF